jgi:hypothetical protein
MKFLWKWLFCSWAHRRHRCYPEVWDLHSTYWHCTKCHECGSELDDILHDYSKDR